MLTYETIRKDEAIQTYITRADESLAALGFTEHSFPHVCHVADMAGYILTTMGYDERTVERLGLQFKLITNEQQLI